MGQDIVKRILLDLNGKGTLAEITKWGREHYPGSVRDSCQIIGLIHRMRRKWEVARGTRNGEWVYLEKDLYLCHLI